jgi:hypothetical protein
MLNNIHNVSWPGDFSCSLAINGLILPNAYTMSIGIVPLDGVDENIAVGFRKIKFFVEHCLQNSIFIFKDNPLLPALNDIDNNLVIFPTEPYDYFVGAILLNKFMSISEKYFEISVLTIDSIIGDRIQYYIEHPDESGLDLSGENWWNNDTINTGFGNTVSWDELNINDPYKFKPTVVKGGLGEN